MGDRSGLPSLGRCSSCDDGISLGRGSNANQGVSPFPRVRFGQRGYEPPRPWSHVFLPHHLTAPKECMLHAPEKLGPKAYNIRMQSGRYVDLASPSSKVIDAVDLAWALSNIARFNGHAQI